MSAGGIRVSINLTSSHKRRSRLYIQLQTSEQNALSCTDVVVLECHLLVVRAEFAYSVSLPRIVHQTLQDSIEALRIFKNKLTLGTRKDKLRRVC